MHVDTFQDNQWFDAKSEKKQVFAFPIFRKQDAFQSKIFQAYISSDHELQK